MQIFAGFIFSAVGKSFARNNNIFDQESRAFSPRVFSWRRKRPGISSGRTTCMYVPRSVKSANYFPPRDALLDRVAKWGKNEAAYNKPSAYVQPTSSLLVDVSPRVDPGGSLSPTLFLSPRFFLLPLLAAALPVFDPRQSRAPFNGFLPCAMYISRLFNAFCYWLSLRAREKETSVKENAREEKLGCCGRITSIFSEDRQESGAGRDN